MTSRNHTSDPVLLGSEHCHLCEQAVAIIRLSAPDMDYTLVDISLDDDLFATYGTRVPVFRWGQRELDWPFDETSLNSFLTTAGRDSN